MSSPLSRAATQLAYGVTQLPRVAWYIGHSLVLRELSNTVRQRGEQPKASRRVRTNAFVPDRSRIYADLGKLLLQDLANETGGRPFYPYHVDDLDQSFQDIGEELRNQYSLAYNPTNHQLDGRYHKIKIEMPGEKGYQVRARRGYYARVSQDTVTTKPSGTSK